MNLGFSIWQLHLAKRKLDNLNDRPINRQQKQQQEKGNH
jgi:hypothetical protein